MTMSATCDNMFVTDKRKRRENMTSTNNQKEMEINKMVTILQQIDVSDIELLTRDANTLLMRKKRAEMEAGGCEGN